MLSWTTKRQITGKIIIPLKSSVANFVSPVKVCLHTTFTPSPATPDSSSSTFLPEGENSYTPGPESPASTPRPDFAALTPPCLVVPTLYPSCLAFAASVTPLTSTPLSDVYFLPVIHEALLYANLTQANYPLPAAQEADYLASTAKSTTEAILRAPSLLVFIVSQQQRTLGVLPEAVSHPAAYLLQSYTEEGIPASLVLWFLPTVTSM